VAIQEAIDVLESRGIYADYMRICGFPFHQSVGEFLCEHTFCFIVEQNRDAQLRSLLTLETSVAKDRLRSILVYGGFPLSARHVVDEIVSQIGDASQSEWETQRAINS
jgi:2-oxoglutarate ferredoxin oxidoreductase subunit alpha